MREFIVDEDFHPDVSGYPELIRCKDCDNVECEGIAGNLVCAINGFSHPWDWFCADGERRET